MVAKWGGIEFVPNFLSLWSDLHCAVCSLRPGSHYQQIYQWLKHFFNLFTLCRIRQKYRARHFNREFCHCAVPVENPNRSNVNEFASDLCHPLAPRYFNNLNVRFFVGSGVMWTLLSGRWLKANSPVRHYENHGSVAYYNTYWMSPLLIQ